MSRPTTQNFAAVASISHTAGARPAFIPARPARPPPSDTAPHPFLRVWHPLLGLALALSVLASWLIRYPAV